MYGITIELTYAAAVLSGNFVTTPTHDKTLNYTTLWIGFYNDFNRYVDENDIKYTYSADVPVITINFNWLSNYFHQFVFMLHDKHNRSHSIRLYKICDDSTKIIIDEIYVCMESDCYLLRNDGKISITGNDISKLELNDNGRDSDFIN